ncbi:MAG: DEAD/DEAH box helicase, partial [Dehalococcoidia bacterium]
KQGGRDSARSAATAAALASGGYELPDIAVVDGIDAAALPPGFQRLGLSERALAVVSALGFREPTPIQEETIPILMKGADVVGQAQTGTGKTLAFGLAIVEQVDPTLPEVQAIVLVPTRELAQQVHVVLAFLAEAMGMSAIALMGGRRLDQDFRALEARPHIVVGTPGRIIDHLGRRTLSLARVRVAVLDEADRMLDIGFEPDMRRILRRCPEERQTALFSATIPTAIKTLIWRYMRDPVHIQIEPEQRTAREIRQRYYEVAERDKLKAFMEMLPEMNGRTLVFCNMKVTVDRLVRRLRDRDIPADAIHGDLDQRKRDRVMQRFRSGDLQILVATNVAARGLDIPDVKLVLNFDLPQTADEYIHRVGRTGRAGRDGLAISFVAEWDLETFAEVQKVAGDALEHRELALYAT